MQKMIKLWLSYNYVFIDGLFVTLKISAITVLFGTVLGILVALLKMSKSKALNAVSSVYIDILRGTPVLLQLYFFWLALPKILPFDLSDYACIVIALTVNSSAYISEIIRAGISAVDVGQWEACKSLGLSNINMFRKVIFPQAIKNILPALGNQFISMVKETSLSSVFFIGELMTSYKTVQSATFLSLQSLCIVGIIYFVLNCVLSKAVSLFERRLKASDR